MIRLLQGRPRQVKQHAQGHPSESQTKTVGRESQLWVPNPLRLVWSPQLRTWHSVMSPSLHLSATPPFLGPPSARLW